MPIPVADSSSLGVLLIDAQPYFWNFTFGDDKGRSESILIRMEHLLMLADWMDIPFFATFEHPIDKNGELPERLLKVFPAQGKKFTKHTYNCCLEPTIREEIKSSTIKQFAVAGAETDVCIMQSVLGLLEMGYDVFLLEDCLFTSEPHPGPAIRRMYNAGAIPVTFKSLAYELVKSVDHTPWLKSWVEKEREGTKPFPDNFQRIESFPAWDPKL